MPTSALVADLTNPEGLRLERVAIRTRESSVTQSAWRLTAVAEEGEGTIALVEVSAGETFYRGDGVFLGWPRDRLEGAYRALLPPDNEPDFELSQLG